MVGPIWNKLKQDKGAIAKALGQTGSVKDACVDETVSRQSPIHDASSWSIFGFGT